MDENHPTMQWLLSSDEPWTRYRCLLDLLELPDDHPRVQAVRAEMLAHPQVQALIAQASGWPGYALRRHNDSAHPLYAFSVLADFGLRATDPGMQAALDTVLAHQSPQGAFQSLVNIPQSFGGAGEDDWSWMLCDAPTLLYALLAMGMGHDERVQRAAAHLASLVSDNGWRCVVAPELGKFRGPGRKEDPCPIANVYAIKALALVDGGLPYQPAANRGAEMLLRHWEYQKERKIYLFGIGSDFRKVKYPFIWYDILHVAVVLSHLPAIQSDLRYREMLAVIETQADSDGRYTAGSMYRPWQGWSFADKKRPSPWLTLLALRLLR